MNSSRFFLIAAVLLLNSALLAQSNTVALINQPVTSNVSNGLPQPDPKTQGKLLETYGKLPLRFEANWGQTDARVKFLSRGSGYTLFLTGDEAVFSLTREQTRNNPNGEVSPAARQLQPTTFSTTSTVLRMKLVKANPAAKVIGEDELPSKSNYFIGEDPKKWHSNVATYAKVKYEGIYSGIDLIYYGNQRQLEYDFVVAPGADPHRIAFDLRGAKRIQRDEHGDLVLKIGGNEIRWHRPVVYQEKNGTRKEIAADYAVTNHGRVGFEIGKYDASRPLYIDPLIYSTYLGGIGADLGSAIAVDSVGNAYVTGWTLSTNFPTTSGAFQTVYNGCAGCGQDGDAFVVKINATGSALVYSTYLGGNLYDSGDGIAVDSAGNAYVTGWTQSANFPTTPGAFQTTCSNNCASNAAFVTKLNPTGSALVYSTYLGSASAGYGIAVDISGNAYVTGDTFSTNFPTTPGAFRTICSANCTQNGDAFVTKLNSTATALVYSTYLGGSAWEAGFGIALDGSGDAYVTGYTYSTDFPTMNPLQSTGTAYTAFVSKFNPQGSALIYSTYLGGSGGDQATGIAVDSLGNAYVVGLTQSTNFPTTPGVFQTMLSGFSDVFVVKINATGSALVYSTYLGGNGDDDGSGIALDSSGNAYVTGYTSSTNFPTTPGAFQMSLNGLTDAFVTEINPTGSALVYSTYLGGSGGDGGSGIAVDSSRNAYVTGGTDSPNFSTMNPLQAVYGGAANCPRCGDAFVTKLSLTPSITTATFLNSALNPSGFGQSVTFTATVTGQGGGTPTGEVTFTYESTSPYGITALCNPVTLSGGMATCSYSALPIGSDTVTATYSGDASFASSSSSVSQTVNTAATRTTLTSSANPSVLGHPVTFTATVTTSGSTTPTGTVTFWDGSIMGTSTLNGSGVATYTTSSLAVGQYSITATYIGDSNNAGSTSAVLTQTVQLSTLAATTTTLASSANPSTSGSSVTFTATVTTSGSKMPTGTVTFKDGSTSLGSGTLNASGIATFATSSLAVGQHSITAVYGGDPNNAGSTSAVLTQTVNATTATTTTTLASSANPSMSGSSVTFTATVTTSGSKTPTGTVTFKDGATTLGTGTLSGSAIATFATSSLAVATHSITAVYGGDANNAGSTSTVLTQTVNKATTTVALASSANPSAYGSSVTFTATVTPATATGTVTFMDGATTLGTGTLSGGVATYATSTLAIGQHSITAVYGGDANNAGSTSTVLTQTVNKATTTVALASSANPSAYGSAVTLTATVTSAGSIAPTGFVTFQDGSTTLGTSALNGSAIATFATSTLAVGAHSITATYGGDTNNAGSTSAVLIQTVQQPILPTTTTTLVSSANPSMSGSAVTFTATVTTTGPIATTGFVTFMDGSTTLGTGALNGGITTFTTAALALGQQSITAVYGGDSNNAGSASAVLIETVNAADFILISNPPSTTVSAGQSGTFTLTVTPQGSFTSPISFSCTGLPTLAGCGFSPASVTPNSGAVTTTLTISTAAHSALHAAALTPSAPGRRPGPLYAIWLILPAMLLGMGRRSTANHRKRLSYCLALLLVGGCLLQVACGGGSMGGSGGGGGTSGTPAGTYTVTVTGAAGSTQQTMAVTLTVQ